MRYFRIHYLEVIILGFQHPSCKKIPWLKQAQELFQGVLIDYQNKNFTMPLTGADWFRAQPAIFV